MNSYELILLFDPNLGEEKIAEIISKTEDKIKSLGGEIEKTDKWGIKTLQSTLSKARKLTQAYYVLICFKGASSIPAGTSSFLKVNENIVRHSICRAIPKTERETQLEEQGEVQAVHVGEIKEVEPQGESLGQS